MIFVSEAFESINKGLQEAIDYESGKPVSVRVHNITVTPLPHFEASEIRNIRTSLTLSQSTFSHVLGVSPKTIEAWESGRNIPQGPALRMLELLKKNPNIANRYISSKL
jgi:putative transcriptional regulator